MSMQSIPSIFNGLHEASLPPARTSSAGVQGIPIEPTEADKRKKNLMVALSSLWRLDPKTMMDLTNRTAPPEQVQQLYETGRFMDSIVQFFCTVGDIPHISSFLLDEKRSLDVAALFPAQAGKNGEAQSRVTDLGRLTGQYDAIRKGIEASTKNRDVLLSTYTQASLYLDALPIFKEWAAIAFKSALDILRLQKELKEIKALIGEEFANLHDAFEKDAKKKQEFDKLFTRFKEARKGLLKLEEDQTITAQLDAVRKKLKEFATQEQTEVSGAAGASKKVGDVLGEVKENKKKINRVAKIFYEHLLKIFEENFPQVITSGLCLENELVLLSFVFELEIPVNRVAATCRGALERYRANYKPLREAAQLSLNDITILYQQWLDDFKKRVQAKEGVEEKMNDLAPKLKGYAEGFLKTRWYRKKKERPDDKIFAQALADIEERQSRFLGRVEEKFTEIKSLLQNEAEIKSIFQKEAWYEETSFSLDWLECYTSWLKAGGWTVSWPAYLKLHNGTASGWLKTHIGLKDEASKRAFAAELQALEQLTKMPTAKPPSAKVEAAPAKPASPQAAKSKVVKFEKSSKELLHEFTTRLAQSLQLLNPKSSFFNCFFHENPPEEAELWGHWNGIGQMPETDWDLAPFQAALPELTKSVESAVEWGNVQVNAINCGTLFMLALAQSSGFAERLKDYRREAAERASQLADFRKKMHPFEELKYLGEDQGSSDQQAKFGTIALPPLLASSVIFNSEKLLIAAIERSSSANLKATSAQEQGTFTFLEVAGLNQDDWDDRATAIVRKQHLNLLKGLKQQVESAHQEIPDTITRVFHYFRVHYLFDVTAKGNELLTTSATLKAQADKLANSTETKPDKKLSEVAQLLQIEEQAGTYPCYQKLFIRSLAMMANFHKNQRTADEAWKLNCTRLLTDLELLKFYAATEEALRLFKEANQTIETERDLLLKQMGELRTKIDANLAATAKFLDAANLKQQPKAEQKPAQTGPAVAPEITNEALWEQHQKSLQDPPPVKA